MIKARRRLRVRRVLSYHQRGDARSLFRESGPELPEQDFRHHALIFVAKQMTMEERHAANDRVGKIHNQIHRAAIGDIHCIDPCWIFHWLFADAINQKVDLMDVKRMHLPGWVHDAPVVQRTDIDCQHRAGIHFEFLPIYIEALFIFREVDNELRVAGFDAFENSRRKGCIDWRSAERRPGLKI